MHMMCCEILVQTKCTVIFNKAQSILDLDNVCLTSGRESNMNSPSSCQGQCSHWLLLSSRPNTHKDRILWQKVLLLPDTVSAKLLCCTVLSA